MRNPAAAIQTGEHSGHETASNQAFGFWIYIMSDLVLFSVLFATFAVVGGNYAGGPRGKDIFDLPYLFGETMLLLMSSTVFGLATLAAQADRRRAVLWKLAIIFLLGLGFIAMEIGEFRGMILAGNRPERSAFLSAFFTLVGTHGVHVLLGLVWMAAMMCQISVRGLTVPVRSRLARLGMFWHFLDILWIGIFSIVYLMGVA